MLGPSFAILTKLARTPKVDAAPAVVAAMIDGLSPPALNAIGLPYEDISVYRITMRPVNVTAVLFRVQDTDFAVTLSARWRLS